MPRYLVIGKGGREHALAWKLSREPDSEVFVAPGSDGIGSTPNIETVAIPASDHIALAEFAETHAITLTIVGPEAPLVAGIADLFRERGLPIVGPSAAAAKLEGSKAFAKTIMAEAGIPTAQYSLFNDVNEALDFVATAAHPLVIKADGLAGGKGVVISDDLATSRATLLSFMEDGRFGAASGSVVVEECLHGPELSFMVVTDGNAIVTLATSRDHKRLRDGDKGPNTGGMGAVSPSPDTSDELEATILELVIEPTLRALRARDLDYRGFLYAGLMLTPDGPKVLEFNVRLGDPETQALMFAMETDLGPTLLAAAKRELQPGALRAKQHACCVVLAAEGYPEAPKSGAAFGLVAPSADAAVFHAGTRSHGDLWKTAGGRVLSVVGVGPTAEMARERAYAAAAPLEWPGRQMRSDIGS